MEKIIKETTNVSGFALAKKEVLLLTKLTAFQNRKSSVKGQKDLIDIISLALLEDFDFNYFLHLIKKYKLKEMSKILEKIVEETKEVAELNLNRYIFAKKKKKY